MELNLCAREVRGNARWNADRNFRACQIGHATIHRKDPTWLCHLKWNAARTTASPSWAEPLAPKSPPQPDTQSPRARSSSVASPFGAWPPLSAAVQKKPVRTASLRSTIQASPPTRPNLLSPRLVRHHQSHFLRALRRVLVRRSRASTHLAGLVARLTPLLLAAPVPYLLM